MSTPCVQSESIATIKAEVSFLKQNHQDSMEMMKEIKDDVKEIKKYIFEGGMDNKYARKESVARLWTIVRSVIGVICLGAGSYLATLILKKGG